MGSTLQLKHERKSGSRRSAAGKITLLLCLFSLLFMPSAGKTSLGPATAVAAGGLPYYETWVDQNHERVTTFDERRQAYLTDNGAYFADDHPFQAVWAWLENDDPRKSEGIQMLLHEWDAETVAASAAAYRALMHPNTPAADQETIVERYINEVELAKNGQGIFAGANLNAGIQRSTGVYLFLQTYPQYNVSDILYTYPEGDRSYKDFCFEDRCYQKGKHYDLFQLLEDYIQYRYAWYVNDDFSSNEFDVGAYMWTYLEAAILVHDFAVDTPLRQYTSAASMRAKSKMVVDFLLLDMGMEFSADQWGGAKGAREYYNYFTSKRDITAQHCILLGLGCAYSAPYKPYYDIYLSDYRTPAVILDATDIRDEPDDYWHLHMEYNSNASREGKQTYVTKFYNLGGGFDYSWMLNVKSDSRDENGLRIGVPFRLFTRDIPIHDDVKQYKWPEMLPGGSFRQYRNAIFSNEEDQNLHVFTSLHQDNYAGRLSEWDVYYQEGTRHYFQEGRTMVILELDQGGAFMEVAIQGVDYPDLESFKTAFVGGHTTSHGDELSSSSATGEVLVNGQPVYRYPFDRLETVDYQGNSIIEWDEKVMTVSRHSRTCVYDFNNWTYTGDCGESPSPPPQCDPDLNKDGSVDIVDLQLLVNLNIYGNPGGICADLNADGNINDADVSFLILKIFGN